MTRARVEVLYPSLTFYAHVPRRRNVTWQSEHNQPGVGSFEIHADDPLLSSHPQLLDAGKIVRVYVNTQSVHAWQIEAVTRVTVGSGENAENWLRVSGRGVLSLLGNAAVQPEYPLRYDTADDRSFDYGSKDGGWKVTADWVTPLGIRMDSSSSFRKGYPTGWPDKASQWLWSTDPNAISSAGFNYFRGTFTLTATTRVRIYVAGDDWVQLQLNGEVINQLGTGQWHTYRSTVHLLPAGTHLLASWVKNVNGNAGAGFLCCVAKVDNTNKVLSILKRSTPSSFKVRGYGSPPGWFSASILRTLVLEAQARSVAGFAPISLGFTDTLDFAGASWTGRHDRSFRVGYDSYLDVLAQLCEHDIDVAMTPYLELLAWKARGTDRRATVRLVPAVNVLQAEASSQYAKIRNRSLVRHKYGWVEVVDSTSESTYGRRETGFSLGGSGSDSQATTSAHAALVDTAYPEITVPVSVTSEAGPQPYADFDIYDIITAPGITGALGPHRVMSISASEDNATGVLTYALQLYPET